MSKVRFSLAWACCLYSCHMFGVVGLLPLFNAVSALIPQNNAAVLESHVKNLSDAVSKGAHNIYQSLLLEGKKRGLGDENVQLAALGRYAIAHNNDLLVRQVNEQILANKILQLESENAELKNRIKTSRYIEVGQLVGLLLASGLSIYCIRQLRAEGFDA